MSKGKKKHTGAVFTLTAIIALVMGGSALDLNFGLGGDGDDIGVNSGNVSLEDGNESLENGNDSSETPEVTPGVTPTDELATMITDAPEEPTVFDIIIDKDTILYNNETFDNVQSLIEAILEDAGENAFYIILHDETAIENTLEDVKNAFDKSEIVWTMAD